MWHCPHCGTPQAETARCWVCRRSSTTCSTCRHFRLAVTQAIGYCGLDRTRRPLRGDEIRGCWEGRPAPVEDDTVKVAGPARPVSDAHARLRQFVPLEGLASRPEPKEALPSAPAVPPRRPPGDLRDRVTLFDLEA
jgi:hypothetical protein